MTAGLLEMVSEDNASSHYMALKSLQVGRVSRKYPAQVAADTAFTETRVLPGEYQIMP
jgi:hypothetical protein